MDRRCASKAFFSAFRAWQIAYQKTRFQSAPSICRKPTSVRSRAITTITKDGISQQRWMSTQPNIRKVESRRRSANQTVVTSISSRPSDRKSITEALGSKYPELELDEFMQKLEGYLNESHSALSKHKVRGAGALKSLMRVMPHSTVLIATLADESVSHDPSLKDTKRLSPYSKHFRGAIVSSMTSVTLGPPAIISFNFKEPSSTLNGIRANQLFSVHFLKADAQGARIAQCFLNHPGDHSTAWKAVSQDHETMVASKLDYNNLSINPAFAPACPLIKGPGIAANLTCRILPEKCITGIGDHSIIVAEVVHSPLAREGHETVVHSRKEGYPPLLLYSEGKFRKHGDAIEDQVGQELSDSTAVARLPRGQTHPDMHLRRDRLFVTSPVLYEAASRYIDEMLDKAKTSELHRPLRTFLETMNRSQDKRAKFLSVLVLWRYERECKHAEDRSTFDALLHRPQTVPEIIRVDSRLREVTEKLAELSASQMLGETAADTMAQEFSKGDATTSEALHESRNGRHPSSRCDDLENPMRTESGGIDPLGKDVSVEEALRLAKAELENFDSRQPTAAVSESQEEQALRSDLMIDSVVEEKAFAPNEKTNEQGPVY